MVLQYFGAREKDAQSIKQCEGVLSGRFGGSAVQEYIEFK
jgi:hypothetical protein